MEKRNLYDELVEVMQALREERMKVKPINTEKEYKAAIARTTELLAAEPKPGWSEDDEELKLLYREMQDYELRRGDVAPASVLKRLGLWWKNIFERREVEALRHDIARYVAICAEQATEIERLREAAAAARIIEREACIRACDKVDLIGADECIAAIRARGGDA